MSDNEEINTVEKEMEVDSSDSKSSDDEDEILEKRANELESKLSKDALSYDTYVELVGIYKKLFNLTEMRSTYERFHEYYPLTGQLWLDWIRDEIRVANTENEKKYIISLFDKAVEDYLSIDLWLEFVQFSIGLNDVDFTRKVFENAINACGLHFMKGSLIWDAYREYELALLAVITETDSETWKQQVLKVNEIFRRQLSVPLFEMERTFVEWRVWVERLSNNDFIDKDPVNWAYKQSTKYIDDYDEFEDKLREAKTDEDKLKVYRKYISYERKPEIMRCLYERAISEFSLNADIWFDYCIYYFELGNYSAALNTCQRAVRNCTWNTDLWVFNIRILEAAEKSHTEITHCLEKALNSVESGQYIHLWLAYLEHFRRISDPNKQEDVEKLRKAFEKGNKHLENYGLDADPECNLLRFWAKVEASLLKNITAARNIWNDYGILKILGNYANTWLDLINLEQQYGDEKHIRKTYQRALTSTKDWPQCIIQSWTNYERQFGTVESIITCTETCRKFLKKWNLEHVVEQQESLNGKNNETETHKLQGRKRKFEQKNLTETERKLKQEQRNSLENEKKLKQVKISDDTPVIQNNEDKQSAETKEFDKIEVDSEKQQRSVFISNLDYSVTENELKNFLGPVEELRLVKDRKGNSKGYAYCVFTTKEEAQKVLKRDRELLNSRPVFISECKVDKMKREVQFRYPTTQEKHKLFIKGLPLTITQEKVEELFKPYGDLKEVRLVTYRNGRPKGLAYVEFKDENDAAKAIIGNDKTDVDGYTITVAISDPPKRKTDNVIPVPEVRHSKSRLQIPLLPRSVQTQITKPTQTAMTNEDFRKMFTSK